MSVVPMTPWLYPEEHYVVVSRLVEGGMIKFDNNRSLPTKSGGKTDIYINLRDGRDDPASIDFLAGLYEFPLRRLGVDRFVEVPDSVSCFAGPLALKTDLPYLTIREQPKEGLVAKAKVIGHPREGEDVAIMDDVVTDGASKISPYRECLTMGLKVKALVILVDRQQGWQQMFTKEGIDLHIWSGMTLHDVRRCLISSGMMQRCLPEIETKNPIIVALDGKDWHEILPLIDQLRTTGCIFKVNDLLFAEGIIHLLLDLLVYGRVMVDLKCHDIPATVANTCKRLRPYAPWAVTVHASGQKEMIQAAVKALEGTPTKVLGVTVLTSLDPKSCEEVYTRQPFEQVMRLAEIANQAGAHGLVCSPQEVGELRKRFPQMTIVTPGVRSVGVDAGDQKRVDTPLSAIQSGANHIVMGRQILGASDPVSEIRRVLEEELGGIIA